MNLLNVITVRQSESDYNNQMITISKISTDIKYLLRVICNLFVLSQLDYIDLMITILYQEIGSIPAVIRIFVNTYFILINNHFTYNSLQFI